MGNRLRSFLLILFLFILPLHAEAFPPLILSAGIETIVPTMVSATVPSAGTTVTLVFNENVVYGAGGNGGWTLNTPTDAMTYSSGTGTTSLVFTLAATIVSTDTPTITYTQPGNGYEDRVGNDLATLTAQAVVNNSTQTSGDSCTGALLFSWHAETTDVTTGTPPGCSAGDTTATASTAGAGVVEIYTAQYQDGTHSMHSSICGTYHFTMTNQDILTHGAGTIILNLRVAALPDSIAAFIFRAFFDETNLITIAVNTNGTTELRYTGNAVGVVAYNYTALSVDTWYKITANWRTGATDPSLSLQIDAGTVGTTNTDLTALVTNSGTMEFSECQYTGFAREFYIDNIKIYNNWQ